MLYPIRYEKPSSQSLFTDNIAVPTEQLTDPSQSHPINDIAK